MLRFMHIALIGCAALAILALAGLIWLRYPDNHGAGPDGFRWIFGVLIVAAVVYWLLTSKANYLALGLSIVGLATNWFLDRRNFMVDYDEWIKRGMPEWGSMTSTSNAPAKASNPPPGA